MTEFRFSKALEKAGLSYKEQGLIYFSLVNFKTQKTADKILNLCLEIAGEDYQGLYRFLTDDKVNHNFIEINYNIPPKRLFVWKNEFYLRYHKGK